MRREASPEISAEIDGGGSEVGTVAVMCRSACCNAVVQIQKVNQWGNGQQCLGIQAIISHPKEVMKSTGTVDEKQACLSSSSLQFVPGGKHGATCPICDPKRHLHWLPCQTLIPAGQSSRTTPRRHEEAANLTGTREKQVPPCSLLPRSPFPIAVSPILLQPLHDIVLHALNPSHRIYAHESGC